MGKLLQFSRRASASGMLRVSPRNPFRWTWAVVKRMMPRADVSQLGCAWLYCTIFVYVAAWELWLMAHVHPEMRAYLVSEGLWEASN